MAGAPGPLGPGALLVCSDAHGDTDWQRPKTDPDGFSMQTA
jgi:hypothetical protein